MWRPRCACWCGALLLAALALEVRGGNVAPLSRVEVGAWDEGRLEDALAGLQRGAWWVRVGDTVFSPAPGAPASPASDYRIFQGDGSGVPADFRPLIVGSQGGLDVHILHATSGPAIAALDKLPNVAPLRSGTLVMVPLSKPRQGGDAGALLDLEEDEEDEEDVGGAEESGHGGQEQSAADASARLADAIKAVTPAAYMSALSEFVDKDGMRYVDTPGHAAAAQFLACKLSTATGVENGIAIKYTSSRRNSLSDFDGSNLVGCLPGEESAEFVLVGAHYDTLPSPGLATDTSSVSHEAPGAVDNGSGVAAVLQAMGVLSQFRFAKTICFAFFDGEEQGLTGSARVATRISKDPEMSSNFLGAVISDMATGFKSTARVERDPGWSRSNTNALQGGFGQDGVHLDTDVGVSQGGTNAALLEAFEVAAKETAGPIPVFESRTARWNSDHRSFLNAKLASVDISDLNHRQYKYWHDASDNLAQVVPDTGAAVTRAMVSGVARLAQLRGTRREGEGEGRHGAQVLLAKAGSPFLEEFGGNPCTAPRKLAKRLGVVDTIADLLSRAFSLEEQARQEHLRPHHHHSNSNSNSNAGRELQPGFVSP